MDMPCKIAEKGLVTLVQAMKNPLTNIKLSIDLLESGNTDQSIENYYAIIKNNAQRLEDSIREICDCFFEQGFTLHLTTPPALNQRRDASKGLST